MKNPSLSHTDRENLRPSEPRPAFLSLVKVDWTPPDGGISSPAVKRFAIFALSSLLILSSCGTPAVPAATSLPGTATGTVIKKQAITAAQRRAAQAQLTGLRTASALQIADDLNWDKAFVVEDHTLFIPIDGKPGTAVVDLTGETGPVTMEFTPDGDSTLTKVTFLSTGRTRVDRVSADGSVTVVERTSPGSLGAQATCAELREEIQELREDAAADNETAFWWAAGGYVALETPLAPAAIVAAAAAARYRSKAIDATNKANKLKSTYTKNCA